ARRTRHAGAGKETGVGLCYLLSALDFAIQNVQLRQQYRSLQGVQPAVHAHANVMVASILSVPGDLPHPGREFAIVGEDRATIAIAAKRLAWEKARARNAAQVTTLPAFVRRSEALGRIFYHG